MKGMLDFLEKAGLVTRDTPQPQAVPEIEIELTPALEMPSITAEMIARPHCH